jgi:hypothetical protein
LDARGNLAQATAINLVESMGGTVIEVPLAAILRARLSTLRGADLPTRERIVQRDVEPPLGWSLSAEVRRGMDAALDGQIGGLDRQFDDLKIALGISQGEVPPCVPQQLTRASAVVDREAPDPCSVRAVDRIMSHGVIRVPRCSVTTMDRLVRRIDRLRVGLGRSLRPRACGHCAVGADTGGF